MTRVLSLTTTAWRSFYESQVAALRSRGIDVDTLEPPGEFRAFDDGIRRRSPLDYFRFQGRLLRASRDDYDLIHANYGLTAPSALCQPIRPVVISLWGGEYRGNRFQLPIRAAVTRAAEVIVPSRTMARRVRRDCHVVPYPVDTDRFRPIPRAEARRYLGWPDSERIVLFPSAKSRPEKDYGLAQRVVSKSRTDAELRTVVNAPHDEMPYYLNASDAVLITSRWESGPMVAKEAIACDVPVVSRPVGFVPRLLDGLQNVAVADRESDLVAALEEVLATDGRPNGRHRLVDYGIDEMGHAIERVYERALGRASGSPSVRSIVGQEPA